MKLSEPKTLPQLFPFLEVSAQRSLLGNPSSVHLAGRNAKFYLDQAREAVAGLLGVADPEEILFTSSATESINTALKGFYFRARAQGKAVVMISSAVEHEATLETLKFLQSLGGVEVNLLPVSEQGELSLDTLSEVLKKVPDGSACLVSLMAANNETGVVFPWKEAAIIAQEAGAVFHLDGSQAPGKLPDFSLAGARVDLASFSAHKIGGPTGIGCLVVRKGVILESFLHGGAQERKRRAGTIHVMGALSFAAAALEMPKRNLQKIRELRDQMEFQIFQRILGVHFNGQKAAARLVNTSNFVFDDLRGEGLLMALDLDGFALSSGSACSSGSIQPSHVLLAMGHDAMASQSALRVSIGPSTTEEEILCFVDCLESHVRRIRERTSKLAKS